MTLPRAQLDTAWFVGLLTLGNTGVLLATATNGTRTELWIFGAAVLLLATASYAPSILHIGLLSSLISGGYGVMLYRSTLSQTDEVLVLPALLYIALVFVSKITTTQAEIQRIVDKEDHTEISPCATRSPGCLTVHNFSNVSSVLFRMANTMRASVMPSCLWT